MATFLMILLLLVGLFLSLIILIQKGRGGGLAGAFGGAGGQSAFGTKAGDVFTKITIVVATIWFVLAGAAGIAINSNAGKQAEQFPQGETSLGAPDAEGGSTLDVDFSEEAGSGVADELETPEESTDSETPEAESTEGESKASDSVPAEK